MKRIYVSFTLLIILSLSLISCHGKDVNAPFDVPDKFDENAKYEISFWAKNDTNITQTEIYEKAISDFESLYPNITVNLKLYNDYGKIYNDVITNIPTDTTPNLCITYPDHIATYLTGKDTVVPLDALMEDENYGLGGEKLRFDSPEKQEIIPKFLGEGVLDSKQYALPFMRSTEVCYVNKTYVERLGFELPEILTWDFIYEVSEKAMEKDKDGNFLINGQKVMIPFIYKSTDNMMIHMLKQLDAPYSDDNGGIFIFNEQTKALLRDISSKASSRTFSTFKISGYPGNFLNAGQCIFAVDSTAGATWMGCDAPLIDISKNNLVRFEIAVLPVPQFNPENSVMISQGPSICIFNKENSGEVMASWLFAQFLLTNDVQIAYASTEGYIPVTSKAHNSTEYTEYLANAGNDNNLYYDVKLKASQLLLRNTGRTFVTPVFNGSASLRNAAGHLIEEVTKSSRRKQTVDDAYIDTLFEDTASLYKLNISDNIPEDTEFPMTAKILMYSLAISWLFIGIYYVITRKKS